MDLGFSQSETIEHIINVLSSTYIKTCCRNSYFLCFYFCSNIDIFLEYFYLFHFMLQKAPLNADRRN